MTVFNFLHGESAIIQYVKGAVVNTNHEQNKCHGHGVKICK